MSEPGVDTSPLSPPILHRKYRVKWWPKFNEYMASVPSVEKYYQNNFVQNTSRVSEILSSPLLFEEERLLQRIQDARTSKEALRRILSEIKTSPPASTTDQEVTQPIVPDDSLDPYDDDYHFTI